MALENDFNPRDLNEAAKHMWNTPRYEGEIDLVKELRDILSQAGIPEETLQATYDKNRHVIEARERISVVQRTCLNRFLELALISSHISTIGIRAKILPNGSISDWLNTVKETVAPWIKEHNLLG